MYGTAEFCGLLQAIEFLKKEKEYETGSSVSESWMEEKYGQQESDLDLPNLVSDLQRRMEQPEPITLVKDITDQTALKDKEAVFECEIKINYPEISLSWYKGTQKLDTNEKYEIRVVGDRHLLKIRNCQSGDQGNYCIICGLHMSSAKLTVNETKEEQLIPVPDVSVPKKSKQAASTEESLVMEEESKAEAISDPGMVYKSTELFYEKKEMLEDLSFNLSNVNLLKSEEITEHKQPFWNTEEKATRKLLLSKKEDISQKEEIVSPQTEILPLKGIYNKR
ncbi:titin-like [Arapaima gigas]